MTGTATMSMPSGPPLSCQDTNLGTDRMRERLNYIAQARANGVGDLISLPQLVVCGNQSAGKSSVLEAITSIPFPRKDGLCTRFPTEIIIRDAPEQPLTMIASIIPDTSRGYVNSQRLRHYKRSLSGYAELSGVIEDVSKLMGLKTYSDNDDNAPAFVADILRIEVTGPTGLYLSIVDLPGLIGGSEDDEAVELVGRVVDSYLKEPRTIILAVLPAESDIETQPIIRRARLFDKTGQRTIGIITKVDLINRGTENRIAALLRNQGPIKMELGYFLMRNPSPDQLSTGVTTEQRHKKEQEHFQRPEWKSLGLDSSRIGARALSSHCQILLEQHFEKEIPMMQNEIIKLIDSFQEELVDLGEERNTPMSQRLCLSNLIFKFIEIVRSTTNGSYDDQSLQLLGHQEGDPFNKRLRAQVHLLNTDFATFMRDHSQKYQLSTEAQRSSPETHLEIMGRPECLAAWQYNQRIMNIYTSTRGLELSGSYNYNFLSCLFQEQASRWPEIAQYHVRVIYSHVVAFLDRALAHVVKEKTLRLQFQHMIHTPKRKMLEDALDELNKICQDEKMQPITYNHYFTDNIQKARQDSMKKEIEKMVNASMHSLGVLGRTHEAGDAPNRPTLNRTALLSSLQSQVEVDMDQNTCDGASAALSSYYKVAMKTFVDNVCRQVIERHIMRKLPSILEPSTILRLSDEEIAQIAMEPEARVNRRKELQNKLGSLKVTLANLQI